MNPESPNIIDVTLLEPRQKHPSIFAGFDRLKPGAALVIHNDHDPKPLYYQLLGERGPVFQWEYLEEGPEWWKVKITRNGQNEPDLPLGALAAADLRKAEVFKKYGLDFCCGGKRTVKEACLEKGLDATKVESELQELDRTPATRNIPYEEWSLEFLSAFIVNTHHTYARKYLPEIEQYALKVEKAHLANHPELAGIRSAVQQLSHEMLSHMEKEEKMLFPYIASLENRGAGRTSVAAPVRVMEDEHREVANLLEYIRKTANDYQPPADACASYTLLYRMLNEMEEDIRWHVHLENNILFPKALQLEKQSGYANE